MTTTETRQPVPNCWTSLELFVGRDSYGEAPASYPLWLAHEWARDVAREHPGQTIWLFEDGALAETYRYHAEEGMQQGGTSR